MRKYFEPEFKKKIIRLHLEDGRTIRSLAAEYSISKASISNWVSQFRKECQNNEEAKADYDYMKENLNLKKQLAKLQKENDFLKKAAAFSFRKSISGISIYLRRSLYRILKQMVLIKNGVAILLTLLLQMVTRDTIVLYDRSIVASITGKHISAALAKETLQKAIGSQPGINTRQLMLHSNQGSRYTSKEFT